METNWDTFFPLLIDDVNQHMLKYDLSEEWTLNYIQQLLRRWNVEVLFNTGTNRWV